MHEMGISSTLFLKLFFYLISLYHAKDFALVLGKDIALVTKIIMN